MARRRHPDAPGGAPTTDELSLAVRAAILVEAAMPGSVDEAVCEKWEINRSTLQRWRKAIETDPALRAAVGEALARVDPYKEIQRAIVVLVRKATELAVASRSTRDLREIRALIGTLGEIAVSRDAFAPEPKDDAQADRQDPSAPPSSSSA